MNDAPRRCCAHTLHALALVSPEYRWPAGWIISWCLDLSTIPATINASTAEDSIEAGIGAHDTVCGVRTQRNWNPRQSLVIVAFEPLDPTCQVLGLTDLPADPTGETQLRMRLNSAVAWTPDELRRVAMHEFGHALGLGHAPDGVVAVMDPYYNPALDTLQPWDIEQDQLRYGEPSPPPPAADPQPAAGSPTPTPSAPPWLKPFDFEFQIDSPGSYQLYGNFDMVNGRFEGVTLKRQ